MAKKERNNKQRPRQSPEKGPAERKVPIKPADEQQAQRKRDAQEARGEQPLCIVGIGASAGGLSALRTFFGVMPERPGVAFVIVVHLSPEHESHLPNLLQPYCKMPVEQVTETVAIDRNRVYIIPPNANLGAIDTHLRLTKLEETRRARAPIDYFFRTLADTHDGHAVGIVLTGTGSDGSLGLRRIKEHGGLTIAQSPDESEHDGMPRAAIATGMVDRVLPIASMPEEILKFAKTQPLVAVPADGEEVDRDHNRLLQKIFAQVRGRTGHDFTHYKRSTIMRRIQRRMQLLHIEVLADYLEYMRQHGEEVSELFNDLLITVTEFFRDRHVYDRLQAEIIPKLFQDKSANDRLRVWSVGCSTGEEAYSLAMLLLEESVRHEAHPHIQVFASDLHESALARAREGVYPEEIAADISPERLKRFFSKENGHYRVRREVREMVVFAPHDLLRDPPFSHLHLIVCRNLLIYLQRDVQHDVMGLFHYALEPDGLLLLGPSETVERSDLFMAQEKAISLYRRRNVPTREPPRMPMSPAGRGIALRSPHDHEAHDHPIVRRKSFGAVHEYMAERYGPPSVLINQNFDIVHSSARAGRFLELPSGEPTNNVFKLIAQPLQIELRAAIHTARNSGGKAMRSKPIVVEIGGRQTNVSLHVSAAVDPELDGFYLVVFDEFEKQLGTKLGEHETDEHAAATVRELEEELHLTRQRLQGVIEEYESSREEMQASNEELQSANEELRSAMEELETSKEELQSMNEELTTLNQENRHRVEELSQMSSDLQNLLAATNIATIFLDRNLRIVRFTPQVGELFNIRHTDRGRPLSDLTHHLGYPELENDARRVFNSLAPIEREIKGEHDTWFLTRLLPYRTADDRIEGIVITMVDITARQQAELKVERASERLRRMMNIEGVGVMIFDTQGTLLEANDAGLGMIGYTRDEIRAGRVNWRLMTPPEYMEVSERQMKKLEETGRLGPYEKEYFDKSGARRWILFAGASLGDGTVIEYCIDVTDRKRVEKHHELLINELDHRVKNTLAMVSSLVAQSGDGKSIDQFQSDFLGRIQALAGAHRQLSRGRWHGAGLRDLIDATLKPHFGKNGAEFRLEGDAITLTPKFTMTLAMVFHELATNAAKYGAISKSGEVDVNWAIQASDGGHRLHIQWRELSPSRINVPAQSPSGFGSMLIKQSIEYELGGTVAKRFTNNGMVCTISIPWDGRSAGGGGETGAMVMRGDGKTGDGEAPGNSLGKFPGESPGKSPGKSPDKSPGKAEGNSGSKGGIFGQSQ